MSVNEHNLLEHLKETFPHFNCTLQDLRNPSEEFVTSFYTCWLSEFEVNISTIPQAQFSQLQIKNVSLYSDTYSSTIPKLNLLQAIRAFNIVPDFGMLDIVSPTPKRIQSVIKAFCDFYNWCDLRIGSMMDIKKGMKISERKQLVASLVQENQNLKEQLSNILKVIGQVQDAKRAIENELKRCQQVASELRIKKDMLKTQSDEANNKIKEKEAILQKIIKEDLQISNQIKDYSNQIVNSPTLILTDLETLRLKEKEMKTLSEQKRDMVESKMKTQKNLEEVLRSAEGKSGQLEEVLKLIEHKRRLLQDVSDVEERIEGFQEELEEMKSSLMSLTSKKTNRQEELEALNLKWKTLKNQLTQNLEAAKIGLENLRSQKSQMILELKEDAAVEEDINLMMEKIKTHVKVFEEQYERMLNEGNACYERLKTEASSRAEKAQMKAEKVMKKKKPKK